MVVKTEVSGVDSVDVDGSDPAGILIGLEAALLARLKIKKIKEAAAQTPVADQQEQVASGVDADVEFRLAEMRKTELHRVQSALDLWHAGKYGVCKDCEEKISERRLKAMPSARRCTGCQEAEDDRRKYDPQTTRFLPVTDMHKPKFLHH